MDLEKLRRDASLKSLGSSSDEILNTLLSEFKKLNVNKEAKIIDIGCGKGDLLRSIKNLGYRNLFGTDYTDFGKNDDFEFFAHDGNVAFPDQYNNFDVILCSEVIEHIENPWAFTRNLRAMAKRECCLLLSTPNPESFLSVLCYIVKGYFVAFGPRDYPAHITPVSVYEIKNMLNLVEADLLKTVFVKNGRVPGTGILWHSLFPFLSGKRFSENYVIVARFC